MTYGPLPNVEFPTTDGNKLNLVSLAGKKAIVFMWASW